MRRLVFFLAFGIFWTACSTDAPKIKSQTTEQKGLSREQLIRMNQAVVRLDSAQIADSLSARGWHALPLPDGIWLENLRHGSGDSIVPGHKVQLHFRMSLFMGKLCGKTDSIGHTEFVVGKFAYEHGVDLAVRYLRFGDSVRIVVPPNQAHGLTGDGHCIPPDAILVYEFGAHRAL